MATKPKPKAKPERDREDDELEPEKQDARAQPPKVRTQELGQSTQATQATPLASARLPRPQFRPQPHFSPPHVDKQTQDVINALQQTVRSQAILITQYQTLLKLDAMEEATTQTTEGSEAA